MTDFLFECRGRHALATLLADVADLMTHPAPDDYNMQSSIHWRSSAAAAGSSSSSRSRWSISTISTRR